MLVLPGYSICQEIDDNNGVRIYRGYRTKDRMPVFIKAINKETVNPVEISKLMYEYEITQKIGIEGVIKPVSLEQSESVLALVVEDFGAISMSEYIKNYPVSLSVFFDIAVQLKETLSWLHQKWGLAHSPVGRLDVLPGLLQPQVLYGREKEKELLAAAFRSACDGKKETILVSGYPGIGKTMLINKTLRSVAQQKGYYITGKFDQLRKNIPYAAFAEAFRGLVSQLMTKGQGKLDWWKKKLQKAIANNGAVVTEIIPELEWIIGKQNPVETLSHKEAENRFFMVFTEFVKALSWKGHPLVLFLDDLQWADIASINLMRHLAQDTKLSSLLLVGAFRGNEISPEHPLTAMLSEANTEQPTIKHISLMPLELDEAAKLVAGMLNTEQENVSLLSEELYRKSGGNSFFLRELLMYIYEEKLLFFDVQEGIWKWELGSIKNLQPGEDVLDIIAKKLQKLPTETIEVIKLAACIGNRFDMETLAAVYDKSKEETVYRLMPSILAGLILISKKQKSDSSIDYTEVKNSTFEFLHDRVQQTVYSQIPEKEKKREAYYHRSFTFGKGFLW